MSQLNNAEPQYYRLMGRSPFAGTTLAAIGCWAAVTMLAAIYAYADLYIKVVDKISVLILVAFAAAMGFAVAGILRIMKVRNLAVMAIIAGSSALLALYVSWVVWETALLRQEGAPATPWRLFGHPRAVWHLAQSINEIGTFTMRGKPVIGMELWAAWTVEAAAILLCTLLIPLLSLRRSAFCEECGNWCVKQANLVRVQGTDDQTLRRQMETRDFDSLARLGLPADDAPVFHSFDVYTCPKCGQTNLLTGNRVAVKYVNGQRTENAKPVVDRLWVDPADAEAIRALPQRMAAHDPESSKHPA
ncbi:MAG: hypothetical protein ABIP55_03320 [Tepidisphaeraceae bacterium]